MKLPAFQFYPGDWLQDGISGCSLAAQGLWLRMMFVMHSAERRGYLIVNGRSMPDEFIASKCGCDIVSYRSLLDELFTAGVPRKTSDGLIYNKRMVDDEKKRHLTRARVQKHRSNADVTPEKRDCTEDEVVDVTGVFLLPDQIPAKTWEEFLEMRRKKRATPTEHAKELLLRKLLKIKAETGDDPGEVLEQSIRSNWTDVFPLRQEQKREQTNGRQIEQAGHCKIHPDSGTGPHGECWGCYSETPADTLKRIRENAAKSHAAGR